MWYGWLETHVLGRLVFAAEQISPDFRQASHLKGLVEEKIKQGENAPHPSEVVWGKCSSCV